MLIVIADTSPIRYLVQIEQIHLLARLFQRILIPTIVADELLHAISARKSQSMDEHAAQWVDILGSAE